MDQSTITRVEKIARRFLPRHLDSEGIALDICLESWQSGVEVPSTEVIRNTCYDAMRAETTRRNAIERMPQDPRSSLIDIESHEREIKDRVDKLMMTTLSAQERKIIWYRFYIELPLPEIAAKTSLPLNTVREILVCALYKMRQAEQD